MASGPKASTFKNQLERHDANTFGSSLNVTLKMRKMWAHSCFFVETCVCVQVERVGTEFHSQQDQV